MGRGGGGGPPLPPPPLVTGLGGGACAGEEEELWRQSITAEEMESYFSRCDIIVIITTNLNILKKPTLLSCLD